MVHTYIDYNFPFSALSHFISTNHLKLFMLSTVLYIKVPFDCVAVCVVFFPHPPPHKLGHVYPAKNDAEHHGDIADDGVADDDDFVGESPKSPRERSLSKLVAMNKRLESEVTNILSIFFCSSILQAAVHE